MPQADGVALDMVSTELLEACPLASHAPSLPPRAESVQYPDDASGAAWRTLMLADADAATTLTAGRQPHVEPPAAVAPLAGCSLELTPLRRLAKLREAARAFEQEARPGFCEGTNPLLPDCDHGASPPREETPSSV